MGNTITNEIVSYHDLTTHKDSDGNKRMFEVDDITKGALSTGDNHNNIHKGLGYMIKWAKDALANNGTHDIYFTTPDSSTAFIHWKLSMFWIDSAKADATMYKSVSTATSGTRIYARNRNHNAQSSTTIQFYQTGTTGVVGAVEVDWWRFGGGGANTASRSGGDGTLDLESVLIPNTTYIIRITNTSGEAANVWAKAFWYEIEKGTAT